MKPHLMNCRTSETEWLVIVGDHILFRNWRCGPALDYIDSNKLPETSLFKSSNVAQACGKAKSTTARPH
jgi:hypothetical protein